MTLRETAYFWVGTNANLFFVSVGVIAFELGLNVWEALVAVVLGTQPFCRGRPRVDRRRPLRAADA